MSNLTSLPSNNNSLIRTVGLAVFLTGIAAATSGFGIYLFSAILSDMKNDIGFTYADAGIITGLAQVSFFLCAIFGGAISAKIGGGKTLMGSVVICGLTLVLIGYLESVWSIGATLIVLGGMAASGYVPIVDVLTRFISYESRGKVMGLISSGTSYGVFINGLIIPSYIMDNDWRSIWLIVGLLTLSWSLFAYFFFSKYEIFKSSTPILSTAHTGTKNALSKDNLFSGGLIMICALTFINGFCVMPFQNFLAPFLREEVGYSVTEASQIWSLIGFSGMMSGFIIGSLADKIGTKTALMLAYGFLISSGFLILWHPSIEIVWLAAILFAFSFYPIFGLIPSYISKTYSAKQATTIFAIASVTLGLGGMAGNTLGGFVKTYTQTFDWIYLGVGIAAIFASIIGFMLKPEEQYTASEKHKSTHS